LLPSPKSHVWGCTCGSYLLLPPTSCQDARLQPSFQLACPAGRVPAWPELLGGMLLAQEDEEIRCRRLGLQPCCLYTCQELPRGRRGRRVPCCRQRMRHRAPACAEASRAWGKVRGGVRCAREVGCGVLFCLLLPGACRPPQVSVAVPGTLNQQACHVHSRKSVTEGVWCKR